jgi:hypothetical protein
VSLTDLLGMPAGRVLVDHAAVDRLITAAAGATGKPWVGLFEAYMKAASDPELLASDALRAAGVTELDGTRDGLLMLERADAELAAHHANATRMLDSAGSVDGAGRVTLDQGADVGAMIADPVEAERRWQRAKRLGLTEDRAAWTMLDRAALEGGEDKLATAERQAGIARVRSSDDVLAKRLNHAIGEGHRTGDGLKVLDAAIREAREPDEQGNVISLAAAPASNVRELTQPADVDPDALATYQRVRRRMELDAAPMERFTEYWKRDYEARRGTRILDAPPFAADGPVFERRLKAARAVRSGRYAGDRGRQLFQADDRKANEEGRDLVAELEAMRDEWVASGAIAKAGKV